MNHHYWMQIALEQAKKASLEDEIPIGACLVKNEQLIAQNHNKTKQQNNPLAHAEKLVLEEVVQSREKFLYDYTLYVTVEPCIMCGGIIIWSRVGTVVFGCYDWKAGACGSVYNVLKNKALNHKPNIIYGILEKEASTLIQQFFANKRKK